MIVKRSIALLLLSLYFIAFNDVTVKAMHIAEGFLMPKWCIVYFVLIMPFFILGLRRIKKISSRNKDLKMLLALAAAYCFVLSAMKLPSVTGSSSHPTGTGLSAIIFGPTVSSVISTLVLIFQAIFLAHGGITTLGANVFSMGVMGPLVAFAVYQLLKKVNRPLAIFLSAMLGDLATYITTAMQLAIAYPTSTGGVFESFGKFISVFAITQVPLAVIEGIFTVVIFNFLEKHSKSELRVLEEVS
jgi:cobalt/nickel transport system permease protein